MVTRIQDRRGSAAQWLSANPVLLSGEPGFETDTGFRKTGDGATAWASLAYDLAGRYAAVVGLTPSGDTSGATDLARFNAAIASAMSGAKTVFLAPGDYYVNGPIVVMPANSGTGNQPAAVPSLISLSGAGRIGDEPANASAVRIIAAPTFPIGSFLLDYRQNGTPYAGCGANIGGFTLECMFRAAGFRAQGPREFWIHNMTIVSPAAPVAPGDGANGAFSITAIAGGQSAGAYNLFQQITVWHAPADGFWDGTNYQNSYLACMSEVDATGGACYHAAAFNATSCDAVYTDCHYGGGSYAAQLDTQVSALFTGLRPYPGTPWPTKNALLIQNGWQYNLNFYYPPKFTNCVFINNPGVGVSAADGAVVRVLARAADYQVSAVLTACHLGAQTNTTHFAYSDAGIVGLVTFRDATTVGTPTVSAYSDLSSLFQFFNCVGLPDGTHSTLHSQTMTANGTFTVPAGVATLRIITCDGGGGGGGGGSDALTTPLNSQAGGGGGAAGAVRDVTLPVTAGQVLTHVIGAGTTGGAGGVASTDTLGRAGALPTPGTPTYVTGTGVSVGVGATGGGGGAGGLAKSSAVVGGGVSGVSSLFTSATLFGMPGCGGYSITSARRCSPAWPGGASGGGGGEYANATNGGIGGPCGVVNSQWAALGGTTGSSGTTSGTNGASAPANSGAGGGGGGGGASGGAGGAGGAGGSGWCTYIWVV